MRKICVITCLVFIFSCIFIVPQALAEWETGEISGYLKEVKMQGANSIFGSDNTSIEFADGRIIFFSGNYHGMVFRKSAFCKIKYVKRPKELGGGVYIKEVKCKK